PEHPDPNTRPEDGADRWPRPGKARQEQTQQRQPGRCRRPLRAQRGADLGSEPRAWIRVAGGDIERALRFIDGRRRPDAGRGAAADRVALRIGIAAAADIEDGTGPRANRRGRDDWRPGNPNRKLTGLALGRDTEEALPLDGARRRDRVLVAVPGAHINEAVGE